MTHPAREAIPSRAESQPSRMIKCVSLPAQQCRSKHALTSVVIACPGHPAAAATLRGKYTDQSAPYNPLPWCCHTPTAHPKCRAWSPGCPSLPQCLSALLAAPACPVSNTSASEPQSLHVQSQTSTISKGGVAFLHRDTINIVLTEHVRVEWADNLSQALDRTAALS